MQFLSTGIVMLLLLCLNNGYSSESTSMIKPGDGEISDTQKLSTRFSVSSEQKTMRPETPRPGTKKPGFRYFGDISARVLLTNLYLPNPTFPKAPINKKKNVKQE